MGEGGGLAHVEAALVDHDAVIDDFRGLHGLEGDVGIAGGGGPLAAGEIACANEDGAVDYGRNFICATEPTGIGIGEMVTADAVGLGINFGINKVGKPALLVGVAVLPCLDLEELLSPVDVGVTEEVVDVGGSAPGEVGVCHVIGEDGERRDDVGGKEHSANGEPATAGCSECGGSGAGEDEGVSPERQQVTCADVHAGGHGDGKINGSGDDEEGELAAPLEPARGDGEEGEREKREEAEGGFDEDDDREVPPDAVGIIRAEDVGGVELCHAGDVDETDEVGLRQKMQAGDGIDDGRDVRAEGRDKAGERDAHLEARRTGGVAEAVEAPEDEHGQHDDEAEGSGEAESGAGASSLLRGCDFIGNEEHEHGREQNA